jgi:hypothetical protein
MRRRKLHGVGKVVRIVVLMVRHPEDCNASGEKTARISEKPVKSPHHPEPAPLQQVNLHVFDLVLVVSVAGEVQRTCDGIMEHSTQFTHPPVDGRK